MEMTRPSPLAPAAAPTAVAARPGEPPAAQIAKAAFKRLALERLEPTPENYERAWRQESGEAANDNAEALALLVERIVRGVERGGRNWTLARRKEGIQRVIAGARFDAKKLQQRLSQLVNSWDHDTVSAPVEVAAAEETKATVAEAVAPPAEPVVDAAQVESWSRIAAVLAGGVRHALPQNDEPNRALAAEVEAIVARIRDEGATPALAAELEAVGPRVGRVLMHRQHLFDQLQKLCGELTGSLAELAEDGSWVKGQCEAMQVKIDEGLTARGVRSVSDMLHHARARHAEVKGEREQARDALKSLIHQMLAELGELGSKTGDFHQSVGRYAEVIEEADSLESLTGVVREMVAESRAVQSLVQQTQARLQEEHSKATGLSERVTTLENEMRRLSDEVSTDQLTQIANRRGLMQAFEVELAKLKRDGGDLAIGLLDIDNFKRLNDELGHSAGDEALKTLAAVVSKTLRPGDRVARYGGEEFVVLLPQTPVGDGQQILTRLQRSLTGGLFMHKDENVFVTFSAGVTDYRLEERIEDSLERADQALYEAKRTGKNRTCIG